MSSISTSLQQLCFVHPHSGILLTSPIAGCARWHSTGVLATSSSGTLVDSALGGLLDSSPGVLAVISLGALIAVL